MTHTDALIHKPANLADDSTIVAVVRQPIGDGHNRAVMAHGLRPQQPTGHPGDLAIADQDSALLGSARAFAALAHAGQRRESDGAPFIRHPSEVAQLLGDAGCSEVVVAAGLLHDTIDGARVTVARLAMLFGDDVASLVEAVSEDPSIPAYRERKQELRERVRKTGRDAALLFAATKIAEVRELPDRLRRNDERCDTTAPTRHSRTRDRLKRSHQLHMEHYHASLRMLQDVIPDHSLVEQLAHELNNTQIASQPRCDTPHAQPATAMDVTKRPAPRQTPSTPISLVTC